MKSAFAWIVGFAGLTIAGPTGLRASSLFDVLLRRGEAPVLTVTDFTEEGKKWPEASPKAPVYYEAISFGTKNFPGLHGDPSPNSREMVAMIVKALKKQGYESATTPGQATIFLSMSWGYSRANLGALGFLGGDKMDLMWELQANSSWNAPNLLRRGMRGAEADLMMEMANRDLYIASIRAYDLKKLDAGTEVELWHTRIATEAGGTAMITAMPTMITAAAPYIGKETKKPVFRDPFDLKRANVELGPTQMIDFVDPAPASTPTEGEGTSTKK